MASHMEAQPGSHGDKPRQTAAKGVEGMNTCTCKTASFEAMLHS